MRGIFVVVASVVAWFSVEDVNGRTVESVCCFDLQSYVSGKPLSHFNLDLIGNFIA